MQSRDEAQLPPTEAEAAAAAALGQPVAGSAAAVGGELNENMNNGADTGDDPLLIFFEENLKWLQRRTDELKTERAMQKNKFKYAFNHFSFIF